MNAEGAVAYQVLVFDKHLGFLNERQLSCIMDDVVRTKKLALFLLDTRKCGIDPESMTSICPIKYF